MTVATFPASVSAIMRLKFGLSNVTPDTPSSMKKTGLEKPLSAVYFRKDCFLAMKMTYRISNPLINEQKAAALADVRVRQHDFCEWISGLDAPWSIQPHNWKFFQEAIKDGSIRNNYPKALSSFL